MKPSTVLCNNAVYRYYTTTTTTRPTVAVVVAAAAAAAATTTNISCLTGQYSAVGWDRPASQKSPDKNLFVALFSGVG